MSMGILVDGGSAEVIEYDDCDHECTIENTGFIEHPKEPGRQVCLHRCMHGCGLVLLEPADFAQWRFSLLGLATLVARAIGASGSAIEDVPDRIVLVGTVAASNGESEVFLACGLARDDARVVLANSARLNASSSPLLLAVGSAPAPGIWTSQSPPRTAVLAEHATLGPDGFDFDLLRAFPGGIVIEPKPAEWLRVTDAGELLLEDVSGITHAQAKARVTKAISSGKIRTNGKTGHARRIDPDSFSTWRLEQREKDLAAYD
ncbi:MAG: hypothetical protein Q9O74_06440 [Planctomycetota bacterium]|nr:hypothetical protein [Planctomycetota bacterium]